jgi:hypothetical protein
MRYDHESERWISDGAQVKQAIPNISQITKWLMDGPVVDIETSDIRPKGPPLNAPKQDKTPSIFTIEDQTTILRMKELARRVCFYTTQSTFKHPDVVIAGGMFAKAIEFLDTTYSDVNINNYTLAEILGESDIDVFVLNENKNIYTMICDNLWGSGSYNTFQPGDQNTYLKENNITAITKMDWGNLDMVGPEAKEPHQIMLSKEETREELLSRFDYKHCCMSYTPYDDKLFITREAFDAARHKKLVVNNPKKVKDYRTTKFLKRGWFKGPETNPCAEIDLDYAGKETLDVFDRMLKKLDEEGDILDFI